MSSTRKIHRPNDWLDTLPWIDREDPDVRDYVSRVSEEVGFDLELKLREWRRDGIVIFEQVVRPGLLDAFETDLEYLRRHYKDFHLEMEVMGARKDIAAFSGDADFELPGVKFNCIHSISAAACALSLCREVVVLLAHVFGSPTCVLQSLTFRRGSQQPIHIDYPYVRCQTLLAHLAASWIPLEDIASDAGPLVYYPGSHRTSVTGFFDWGGGSILCEPDSERTPMEFSEYLWSKMESEGIAGREFCPRRGDLLVWHGNLAHEGIAIRRKDATRMSYVTHYTSLKGYPASHRHVDAFEAGRFIQRHGGYVFEYPWVGDAPCLPSGPVRRATGDED